MAELPIRKRTLAERLAALSERMRDMDGAPSLVDLLCDEVYELGLEAADLAEAESWRDQARFEYERAEKANEVYMQYALALEPPMPGRWHFGGARAPHLASRCTDGECWSPMRMPDGRGALLRLGWDVELTMVSPRQILRFQPQPDATPPDPDSPTER